MAFRIFNKNPARYLPSSPLRVLFLFVILGLVAWGFWQNTQNQLNAISSRLSVWDEPKVLSDEERSGLRAMIAEFKTRQGIDVYMEITNGPLKTPPAERPLIYMGINQQNNEVMLVLPPLLKKALGNDLVEQIKIDQMQPHMANKASADAWASALRSIWQEINSLQ